MIRPYAVHIAPAAQRQIKVLSPKYQKLVFQFIETLSVNPRPQGAKKIEGLTGLYSEHIDSLRMIYKVEEHEVLILLLR